MNVLIVKPSSLGDVVHTFPAVHLLRQHLPAARLVWVVNREYADLVRLSPDINEVRVFDRRRLGRFAHWLEVPAFLCSLRAGQFSVALDFQGLLRSSLMTFFSRAKRRVGFAAAREGGWFFYTERVRVPPELAHAVDRNFALVKGAFPDATGPVVFPFLRHSQTGTEKADILLGEGGFPPLSGPLVAIAPAARWASKQWPDEFFVRVIAAVAAIRGDATFWLVGTAEERAIGDRIVQASSGVRIIQAMGRTDLTTLVELLRRSRVLLANDSGPMHLGVAVQCPVVALFGPTDPLRTGPYGPGHTCLRGACPVSPCFAERCGAESRTCVSQITPAQAAAAILRYVS